MQDQKQSENDPDYGLEIAPGIVPEVSPKIGPEYGLNLVPYWFKIWPKFGPVHGQSKVKKSY